MECSRVFFFLVITFGFVAPALGIPPGSHLAALTPVKREQIRYQLEILYNELDLLLQNQHSDRMDLRREEKQLQVFRVLDRIPLVRKNGDESLRAALETEARARALIPKSFKLLPKKVPTRKTPREITTGSGRDFRLNDDQLAQEIRFVARVDGHARDVNAWVASWKQDCVRFAEPIGEPRKLPAALAGGRDLWEIRGRAFEFRNIRYPRLRPRSPAALIPAAYRNASFAKREPQLWDLAERARQLIPLTPRAFENRAEFLLASQRMDFYLTKTEKKGRAF